MSRISRRVFLAGGAALVAGYAAGEKAPKPTIRKISANEKLNIAVIGAGGRGEANLSGVDSENIVALCDVDEVQAAKSFNRFPNAKRYKDYREMLDKEKGIDAVVVATPDHVHAPAAMACIQLGKHVYVEKPLTHTIEEARKLREAARHYKVATQMGNQGNAGQGVRNACEWIWDGAIGAVKEVHVWTDRPIWPQGIARPTDTPPVPATLDWNLWLGPAPERPYNPAYAPFKWRGFWDFGCGALGDMGCHIMNPANWALKLGEAKGIIKVSVESSGVNDETAPAWSIITYEFPAHGKMPPVKMIWYDGKKLPLRPASIPAETKLGDTENGSLFIGEKGMLTSGENGGATRLLPDSLMKEYKRPKHTIEPSPGHHREWIMACKGGKPAMSNFDYSGPLTEIVLLGNLALRAGQPIEWDTAKMKVMNVPEANAFVTKKYRAGFEV
ncbi:MAG: Gfo/Idh/MocA family oxidoreductase [Candidatus Hydrogenedentes bacterium]|nr:Gfo/Idh/MocA family oxidoreductase [Candidatus Hydrogenedentota bacterium]